MAAENNTIKIGQFSESAVLAVARAKKLDEKYGINWETQRVPSSPAQFESLSSGEIDIAITSPDNVLLYATTDKNPIGRQLQLRILRTIDRGMGLALYTSEDITEASQLRGTTLGVDVPNSGFAFLLFALAQKLGVAREDYELESIGATPKRLSAVETKTVSATILNAETAVQAEQLGLRKWASSIDVSDNYLGTVLTQIDASMNPNTEKFLELWEEATSIILSSSNSELVELLKTDFPKLSNPEYVSLLQSEDYGLLRDAKASEEQLSALVQIRSDFGAYAPTKEAIASLVAS